MRDDPRFAAGRRPSDRAAARTRCGIARRIGEYWLAVADYDDAVLAEVTATNPVSVIGVRDVTLDEVYLYHVRGAGHHAAAAAVERHSA